MFIIIIILILQISIIYIILYNDIGFLYVIFDITAAALLGWEHEHSYIVSVGILKATYGAFYGKQYLNLGMKK